MKDKKDICMKIYGSASCVHLGRRNSHKETKHLNCSRIDRKYDWSLENDRERRKQKRSVGLEISRPGRHGEQTNLIPKGIKMPLQS